MASHPRRDPEALAVLALALGLGALLRCGHLGALAYSYDELFAVYDRGRGARAVLELLLATALDDQHPPLYYLTLLGWTGLGGTAEAWVRLPSAVAGVTTVLVVWLLGRSLGSPRAGAWASLLTAVSPLGVAYGREARMYALVGLLAVASTACLAGTLRRNTTAILAWYFLTTALLLTHYFGLFILLGQALFVVASAPRREALLWACGAALPVGLFAPFGRCVAWQASHVDHGYLRWDPAAVRGVIAFLLGGHPGASLALCLPLSLALALGLASRPGAPSGRALAPRTGPRYGWVALAVAGALTAAQGLALRGRLESSLAAFRQGLGQAPALAREEGAFLSWTGVALGGGLLFAAMGLFLRDALATNGTLQGTPVRTSAWTLGAVMVVAAVLLPLGLGAAGLPVAVARSFVPAAPFLALLAALGVEGPRGSLARALLVAAAAVGLILGARSGALPGVEGRPRGWLDHHYGDWRRVCRGIAGGAEPVVTVQNFITDAVLHYCDRRPVARLTEEGGILRTGQVERHGGGGALPWTAGGPFVLREGMVYYWIEPEDPHPGLAAQTAALGPRVRASARCLPRRRWEGDGTVYRCVVEPAVDPLLLPVSR
ncbi:MAG: glycosyltransferase family 39 protein [Deltaproteobacteria bacterium]|nr:glycosyltransferase family 39 protein [Deltaproteobacteria bacterium]